MVTVKSRSWDGNKPTIEQEFDNLLQAVNYCSKYGDRYGKRWVSKLRVIWIEDNNGKVSTGRINGAIRKRNN